MTGAKASVLRNSEDLDAEIQAKLDQFSQCPQRNFVAEITIAKKLDDDPRLAAGFPKAKQKGFVGKKAIDQVIDTTGKPLLFDMMSLAIAPTRVRIEAPQTLALGGGTRISGSMLKFWFKPDRCRNFRWIDTWMFDEKLDLESSL